MGNRFVSFVLAYTRSGCRVELDVKFRGPGFSLFPFAPGWSWGFSFVGLGGPGELSLFPCGRGSFPFSLSTLPELFIQLHTLVVGLIGMHGLRWVSMLKFRSSLH